MPNWKKVIVSGSDANLRNITASGDISASGLLHASLSFDTTPVTDGVVVYDTAGGRFYYTGSYGGGSGGTIVIKEDGVTTVAAATTIDFLNSIVTESPSGEANVAFDLQGVTDSGAVTSNGSLFLHNQNSSYGFSNSQLAKSGFAIDNSKAYTYATPQRTQNDVYLLGMHLTANGVGPYPNNFITLNKDLFYQGQDGPYDGGGGGTNPDTDHPDDLGGTLISTGTGFQVLASSSISSITKDNKARGIYITPSAFYMFNTDASASVSGTLIPESASAQIRFNTGSSAIEILAGSTTEDLTKVLFISRSGVNPRVGIGTEDPKGVFDFKDTEDSDKGAELLLRTSRRTKGADVGDDAGLINFTIDSSSFSDIETSGSVAQIAAKVLNETPDGVFGKLSFQVAESAKLGSTEKFSLSPLGAHITGTLDISSYVRTTATNNALGSLRIGSYASSIDSGDLSVQGGATLFSAESNALTIKNGSLYLENAAGSRGHITASGNISSSGDIFSNNAQFGSSTVNINGPAGNITASGNISASGEIIANNGNFTNLTGSNLQILGTASIAYFETLYTTASVIYSSGSTKFGDTMDDQHDFTGSVDISGSTDIEGNLSVSGGTIDLKNSGAASKILLYCESNNAHAQTIQAAPHSDVASNTLVLPSTGTKFATQDGAETFTNKTLTSPDINTPDIDGGTIDNTVIGNSTASAGTFTSLTATNITSSGNISASGNISGSSLHINGTTKNIIASTNGFRISSYTDLKYLESTGNTLQWRTNNDSIFELRSQNGGADDVYIHLEHADAPLEHISIGTNQASGSFFIARDEGFDTNKDFTITGSNGYVGINEPNPTEQLSVNGNISASGDVIANNITASNLDISGDADIDGTLEADAITVNGTALSSVIAGTTVANAINTTNANITATTDDASFFVTMVDGATGDQRVESSTKLKFNPSNGNLFVDGFITASGAISASGDITSNTFETISTTLASDSATNVDTFNSSSYNGAIYDYILKDSTVGARAGQFMVAHDDGNVTFTDTSTKHLSDSTIPEITADINSGNVRVRVTNGNGYTFKSFVKKL